MEDAVKENRIKELEKELEIAQNELNTEKEANQNITNTVSTQVDPTKLYSEDLIKKFKDNNISEITTPQRPKTENNSFKRKNLYLKEKIELNRIENIDSNVEEEKKFIEKIKEMNTKKEQENDVIFGDIEDIFDANDNNNFISKENFQNETLINFYDTLNHLVKEANELELGYIKNIKKRNENKIKKNKEEEEKRKKEEEKRKKRRRKK